MNMFTDSKWRMKWTGQPLQWFQGGELDVSAAKQKMSVPRKRLSPYPLFRVALDVVGHVALGIRAKRLGQTG